MKMRHKRPNTILLHFSHTCIFKGKDLGQNDIYIHRDKTLICLKMTKGEQNMLLLIGKYALPKLRVGIFFIYGNTTHLPGQSRLK